MTHKKTLRQVREDNFFHQSEKEIPTLLDREMSSYEQDELLSELLGNRLRRHSLTQYASRPYWSMW